MAGQGQNRDREIRPSGIVGVRRNVAQDFIAIFHFYMLTPKDYGKFFTKLRSGDLVGFRSELDVAMAKATVGG